MFVLGVGCKSSIREIDTEKIEENPLRDMMSSKRNVTGKTCYDFSSRNSINYTSMLWLQSSETEMTKIELSKYFCLFVSRVATSSKMESERESEWRNIFLCMKRKREN